jgi:V/A-type H+-transporting ATPase subunit E
MENNKENLEKLVQKLREQGINAGEQEKERIVEEARLEAQEIVAKAEEAAREIVDEARKKAEQVEANATSSMAQASRDMVEATRMSVLNFLKAAFGEQVGDLFTKEQYLGELVKAVVEAIPGDKEVSIPEASLKKMEAFLLKHSTAGKVVLKPLGESGTKIVVESTDKGGLQFVLSKQDVEDGLFTMLNQELVERITKGQGGN